MADDVRPSQVGLIGWFPLYFHPSLPRYRYEIMYYKSFMDSMILRSGLPIFPGIS
uniref:Uncharacterized protein n=1 Tax=Triticum urartu TaxID=4572 RepID=A0A8R7NXF3_TRIUA